MANAKLATGITNITAAMQYNEWFIWRSKKYFSFLYLSSKHGFRKIAVKDPGTKFPGD